MFIALLLALPSCSAALVQVTRRAALVGACTGGAAALSAPRRRPALAALVGSSSEANGGGGAQRAQLLNELQQLLREPTPPPIADPTRSARIDAILDTLCTLNPTARPGSVDGYRPYAEGTWRVAFAPHISKLSSVARVRFDPIIYRLDPNGRIESNVRYALLPPFDRTPPRVASGWLSTLGRYGSRDGESTSYVEWEDAWWNPGSVAASPSPTGGAFAPVVSSIGRAGFVSSFADFPVEYLDQDLCVFVFPLSSTRIAAVRQGGRLDVWGDAEPDGASK